MEKKRSRSRSPRDHRNFKPSGILGQYENRQKGLHTLYTQPLDSILPNFHWRVFHFIKEDSNIIDLHEKAYYIIGRGERADIRLLHSSISQQHAAIQFRSRKKESIPFIIDLNSKFGCKINGERIEPARFMELKNKDVIQFGTLEDDFILVKGDKLEKLQYGL